MSTIESVSHERRIFEPPREFVAQANVKKADFDALNASAAADFSGFWAKLAREELLWHKPFTQTLDESNAPFYKWFADGQLNASYNCLDRHIFTTPNRTAIIFEADDGTITRVSYQDLYERVCQFANGLKKLGVKKGDRILVYLPMSIEAVVAMQACARIGAIHSVVFGGFSAKSVQERVVDAGATLIICADEQMRGVGVRRPEMIQVVARHAAQNLGEARGDLVLFALVQGAQLAEQLDVAGRACARVKRLWNRAEAPALAVHGERVDREHVVHHVAVGDRARAAGVVARHAPEGGLRRGRHVDRVPQPVLAQLGV